jgi:hypothetical protein
MLLGAIANSKRITSVGILLASDFKTKTSLPVLQTYAWLLIEATTREPSLLTSTSVAGASKLASVLGMGLVHVVPPSVEILSPL